MNQSIERSGFASLGSLGPWWFLLAAFAVLVLQTWLAVVHEPFVDEWQALQLAVQSPDLLTLVEQMAYEGHPPLWHFFLRVLATVVGPGHALVAAILICGIGTQLLILFRSPFPLWLRLSFALSEPLLFEYGTISRSYALGVVLLFACMALWNNRRWFYVPLALLPFTEFLFGVISIGLLVMRYSEKRLWWPGIGLWLVLSLLAAWTVIPAPDFIPATSPSAGFLQGTFVWTSVLGSVFVPLQWSDGPNWNEIPRNALWFVLWIPLLLAIWQQTKDRWAERAAIGLFLLITWGFYAFYYSLALRHMFLLNVFIVVILWRQAADGRELVPLFKVWAIIGAACGLLTAAINLVVPFDTARFAARTIMEKGLEDETWVALPMMQGQGISAMTGITFEAYGQECRFDFIRWNREQASASPEAIGAWLDQPEQRLGRFYLVSEHVLPERENVRLIEHVEAGYGQADFRLYAINPDDAERRTMRPRCVEGFDPLPPVGW